MPVPSYMASSSFLLGAALQTPESTCLQCLLLDFLCKQKKIQWIFALTLLLCLIMPVPSWIRVRANVTAPHSCISSVLQSHRNGEAGRGHWMQTSHSLYSGGSESVLLHLNQPLWLGLSTWFYALWPFAVLTDAPRAIPTVLHKEETYFFTTLVVSKIKLQQKAVQHNKILFMGAMPKHKGICSLNTG